MTQQCVNCPGAEDHSTAQCPLVSAQKNELRQIITDALVSMVSGVTGLVPPSGPGQIPDFIQAPIDRAVEKISASLPVGVPDGSIYVECRQCDVCQHGGINDAAAGLAACHDCDWTGADPVEDKCPGCQSENCMAAACPKCGSRYVLVASEDIAAPAAPTVKAEQVGMADAYVGAREDLAIWKRRALEAEEKLRAQCDDQSFMGEPLVQPYEAPREKIEALFKQLGFNGQVSVGEILDAALTALKAQQVGQEPAVPECVERIRTLLPRFEAGVNWTGEDAAELAEAAYDAAELLTTKPAPDQDVAGWIPVTERLPEVETDVLVRGVRRNEVMHRVAGLFNGEWSSQETEDLLLGEVTHWMPLPAAPATHDKQSGGDA